MLFSPSYFPVSPSGHTCDQVLVMTMMILPEHVEVWQDVHELLDVDRHQVDRLPHGGGLASRTRHGQTLPVERKKKKTSEKVGFVSPDIEYIKWSLVGSIFRNNCPTRFSCHM